MVPRRHFLAATGVFASGLGAAAIGRAADGAAPESSVLTLQIPRTNGSIEPRRSITSSKLGWSYEIDIALPESYRRSKDRKYPVLWVTDGPQMFNLAVGITGGLAVGEQAPEVIVVAVGCPVEDGALDWIRRRNIEFVPPGAEYYWDGPQGDMFKRLLGGRKQPKGQADDFLAFLIDIVRPALAADYRMAEDHALFGHSGGGLFTCYALFARPDGFSRYIIGSPSLNAVDRACFKLEQSYAATHKDLPASVFFGAGEKEVSDPGLAAWGILSSEALMAETLKLRQYPSLKLATRIFPGKDHLTVIPDILGEGIRTVWADKTKTT